MATTTFNDLITFSRGSNATVTGPNGLIQWAPSNLLTNSQDYEAAAWSKQGSTVFANQNIPGGTLGPERVSNGEFASGADWSLDVGVSIGAGLLTFASVSSTFGASQTLASGFSSGQLAQVTIKVDSLTAGQFRIRINGGTFVAVPASPGTYTFYVQVGSGSNALQIQALGTTSGTIDSISVKEITPAAATAPDGTLTADTIVEDTANSAHGVRQTAALSVLTATLSFYAKKAGREFVNVWAFGGNIDTTATRAGFNLTTGVATVRSGQTATIQDVGNGWYRCTVSIIITAAGSPTVHIGPSIDALTQDYTGDPTKGILIWGAQLELGPTATTYNNTSVRNLLGFSEAFDNAAWTKSGASVVTGAQANPVNGLFNAQKLMENTATATQHYTRQLLTPVVSGPIATLSIYAKAGERRYIGLLEGFSNKGQYFDLQTGTVGGILVGAPSSASITAVGNGWYRCSITTPVTSTTISQELYLSATGTSISYTGDGNSGVYIYGAMLSNSASLDPYVPTPGAAPSSTAYYGPRFDYDPVTLAARGLLIEEQRVNSLTYSAEFDNAAWNKNSATVVANTTVSPDGTTNADTVTSTAGGGWVARLSLTGAVSTTYTASVFAKAGTGNFARIFIGGGGVGGADGGYAINLTTGALTAVGAATTPSVQQLSNGWWRLGVTFTTSGADNIFDVIIQVGSDAGMVTTGSANLWGAQLELGAFTTSYIPTIASTVTRSADAATITGSLFSQWYNQSEGALVVFQDNAPTGNRTALQVDDGTNTNRILIQTSSTALAQVLFANVAGVSQVNLSTQAISPAGSATAAAYRLNDYAYSANGATVSTDTTATVPTTNRLVIGSELGTGVFLNGHIRSIRYVPVRAADFQLQALTAPPELLSPNIYDRFNDLVLDRAGQTIEVR